MAKAHRKMKARLKRRQEAYESIVAKAKDGGKSMRRPGSQSRKKS